MFKWLDGLPADAKPPVPASAVAGLGAVESPHGGGNAAHIRIPCNAASQDAPGETLAALLARAEPFTDDDDRAYLTAQAKADPAGAAALCRLILSLPPPTTAEEIAELDRLIVRLCDLRSWLKGRGPELLDMRRKMAPARIRTELELFRSWVREALEDIEQGQLSGRKSGN